MASAAGTTEDIENESKPLLSTEERARQNESSSIGRKVSVQSLNKNWPHNERNA